MRCWGMGAIDSYIAKALRELPAKSLQSIQVETALTWGGRACAAAQLGMQGDAREYAHEAVEHAALAGNEKLLAHLRAAFKANGVVV